MIQAPIGAPINLNSLDLAPSPDLHPLCPTPAQISNLLSLHSGLSPVEKSELVAHCASRACVFGDLTLLQHLLTDHQAQVYLNLGTRDEDGLGLISLAIHGFGADSDRDVEREECVRLLVAQGADMQSDDAGWTPLHHAALLSPPTLISYLMTHGCSPFALTKRKLTPLDIVTAHSIVPGREDVALLLEEAMRSEGWEGSRMDQRRRMAEQQQKRRGRRKALRADVAKVLSIHPGWWEPEPEFPTSDSDISDDESDDPDNDDIYTPPLDYSSMLVFSPTTLPRMLESLVTNYPPSLKDALPANALYMLTRFACLACDHTWMEELILSATDAIEEAFFNRADDLTSLVFWLYNTTLWLHFIQCDNAINRTCEFMGSFELIEEVINSVFVFIIRFAERRIDQLLDSTLLDYAPFSLDSVQFESEWSFLRSFTGRKKTSAPPPLISHSSSGTNIRSSGPTSPNGSLSPSQSQPTVSARKFSSFKQTFSKKQPTASLNSIFSDGAAGAQTPSPVDLTSFLSALHAFLVMNDVNPVMITQLWSQVFYWTGCEIFNRIITRKKYLCRSRAVQINLNLSELEDWISEAGLPNGVQNHFVTVRDLLNWLQCLSSITEFPDLVATIQSMRGINPLQMRRAVRDYKYEVNEGHMTDECIQYLTQLQKDWERARVKMGVEAMRKEINERERDRDSVSSSFRDELPDQSFSSAASTATSTSEQSNPHTGIDLLFDKSKDKSLWEPIKPPQPLGELLDSRYMIPLLFPADPRMLAALPKRLGSLSSDKAANGRVHSTSDDSASSRKSFDSQGSSKSGTSQDAATGGIMSWRWRNKKIREVGVSALQRIDGAVSAARWGKPVDPRFTDDDDEGTEGNVNVNPNCMNEAGTAGGREKTLHPSYSADDLHRIVEEEEAVKLSVVTQLTPISRKSSQHANGISHGHGSRRGRQSLSESTTVTPVERRQPSEL
ncbi:Dilute domain-containing protein C25B8.08 [Leucoagaricus sp. SymC.cos]|nr:Dilute domain-containing protein C25B8.08 [Leucoagaricus sp. SymC.cos]